MQVQIRLPIVLPPLQTQLRLGHFISQLIVEVESRKKSLLHNNNRIMMDQLTIRRKIDSQGVLKAIKKSKWGLQDWQNSVIKSIRRCFL